MHREIESSDPGAASVEETVPSETEILLPLESSSPDGWLSGWARLLVGVVVLAVLAALVGPQLVNQAQHDRLPGTEESSGDVPATAVPVEDEQSAYERALTSYREGEYGQTWSVLRSIPAYQVAIESYPGITQAEEEVQGDPESKEAHFRLGTQWAQSQLYVPAEEAFLAALALDDQYVDAYSNLGVVYYQMNRLSDAVDQYDRALSISPDDADVHHNRGAAYVQQALQQATMDRMLLNKGMAEFERAVELDPTLGKAYFSLGVIYYQVLGDKENALPMFEKFLELDDGSEAQATLMANQFLQELKP